MTSLKTTEAPVATAPEQSWLEHRRALPSWAPAAVVAVALAVAVVLGLLTALTPVTLVVYTVVLATVALWALARRVEGARKAKDRLLTSLVLSAFGLTLVPLVSLLYEVVRRGIARLDGEFFTYSLVGIIGRGGGAYHAIFGTLIMRNSTAMQSSVSKA
jgi:phosphate transport system permease protein